jgi:hypothetical protein
VFGFYGKVINRKKGLKMINLKFILLSVFCAVCQCRVPTCDDVDRMKTEIQQMVDGERSMIPTAVRFGKASFQYMSKGFGKISACIKMCQMYVIILLAHF